MLERLEIAEFQFVRINGYLWQSCGPGMPGPYGAAVHKRHHPRTYSPTKEGFTHVLFQKSFTFAGHYRRHKLGHLRHLGVQRRGLAAGRQPELVVPHGVHPCGRCVGLPDPRFVHALPQNRRVSKSGSRATAAPAIFIVSVRRPVCCGGCSSRR